MRVTLRQIQVFDAVARHASISKASEEISRSQSAVSVALKELEEGLGVPLFERHRRKLVLNENGRRFQPRARSVLAQVDDLEGAVLEPGLRGPLRIACSTSIGTYLMPAICARFAEEHPEVVIKMTMGSSAEVVDNVDSMKQDIGLIDSSSLRTSLKLTPWRKDALVVFCAPRHPLAGKYVESAQLSRERWALQPLGSFSRHVLVSSLVNLDPESYLQIVFESNCFEAIREVVRTSRAIGCLSQLAVQKQIERGELATIKVTQIPLQRSLNIIVRRDIYHGEVIDAFVQALRASPIPCDSSNSDLQTMRPTSRARA